MPSTNSSIAQKLAEFVTNLDGCHIPPEVRSRARFLILDAVGVALAATTYDFSRCTMMALREFGSGGVPVIGYGANLNLRDAVIMNGFLIHGLDFDDTHTRGVIHATASCFPTALGVASVIGASGPDLITAYIAGMEIANRLGSAAKGGFHQTGFHPTGLIGTFSSALIAGRLKGLNVEQMTHAQGIALSFASGSLEFLQDGAWTKRIHPGMAGAQGINAAALARHGFIGPKAVYEGRFGLYASHLGSLIENCDLSLATEGLGETWELSSVAVKPLPACHFTHASADAAAILRKAYELRPEMIESIRVLVPSEVVKTVCEPVQNKIRPQNSYDAQFSIPFAVASCLRTGRFGLKEMEPQALNDPITLDLAAKVRCEIDADSPFPKYYSGEVIVNLKNGRTVSHREQMNRGSSDRPLSEEEIIKKFHENAVLAVSQSTAKELERQVLELDRLECSMAFAKKLSGN